MERTPTVHDVARRAGVSTATVSRALSGSAKLNPDTLARVLRAVEELGYLPNGAARGLTSRRTRVLAVSFLDHGDPDADAGDDAMLYTDGVVRGMERAARELGYAILIGAVFDPDAAQDAAVSLASRADGIVLLGQAAPAAAIQRLKRLPVVVAAGQLDGAPDQSGVDRVRVDNAAGMTELVRHLVDHHGHTDLLYLDGPLDSPDATERRTAFLAAASGVRTREPVRGDFTQHSGTELAAALSHVDLPDAVVCANDQMAIGVLTGLRAAGLLVPADIVVTGFDGIDLGRHIQPTLTTVRQPMRRIGAEAVALLERRLADPTASPVDLLLPTSLEVRASCGC